MDDAKSELITKLKSANNVLVTVSRNPSVDQLASLLGLTLLLNKQGKHAAAVFSGEVPSTIEFLQPEETIEKNTDSLRDFIIALDKSKADKLRYKVEDDVVRIFITPYKTSISQDDLEFSQGDFNVDVVVAIGVQQQGDLDEAITVHGRILHDATITSINTVAGENLGTINWSDPQASSLSELVTELVQGLDGTLVDNQIATALLTGIVAETERFSNDKTTAQTMSISAALMAAGANQQLIASKLDEVSQPSGGTNPEDGATADLRAPEDEAKQEDGAMDIDHGENDADDEAPAAEDTPTDDKPDDDTPAPDAESDESGSEPLPDGDLPAPTETEAPSAKLSGSASKLVTEPPELGGMLTANSQVESLSPSTDPLSLPNAEQPQLLDRDAGPAALIPTEDASQPIDQPAPPAPVASIPEPVIPGLTPPPPAWVPPSDNPLGTPTTPEPGETLSQLEAAVESPHTENVDVDDARDEVSQAIADSTSATDVSSQPVAALNAQQFGGDLHSPAAEPAPAAASDPIGPQLQDILGTSTDTSAAPAPAVDPLATFPPVQDSTPATPQVTDPTAPPPVPPPIPFQFGTPPNTPPAQ